MLAKSQNIAFLVALAFAVAASANLPTILYSLFWKGFNTKGALVDLRRAHLLDRPDHLQPGGLRQAGRPQAPALSPSMITNPNIDFHWFPLDNPGLVSIPLAFFLGWLGSVLSKEHDAQKYAEMEVRSLTGHGVAEAVNH
jgi:cation/acetate symporter